MGVGIGSRPDLSCVTAEYTETRPGFDENMEVMNIYGNLMDDILSLEGVDLIPRMFKVLDTDYTSYASVYSCYEFVFFGPFHIEFAWVLKRDGVEGMNIRKQVEEAYNKQNVDIARLVW